MDYTFLELQKASMNICELDHYLKQFLQQKGDEFKAMKKELESVKAELETLKEENKRLKETESK